ncbi:MAG: hypothetical protein EOP06_29225 [Proteobacteria bacterium]|nr:MAG: hypothetical protein EOP06_29225 [Pseudomonadota bacterium]
MKFLFPLLAILLFFPFGFSLAGDFQAPSREEIAKAITTFKFRGLWIHPKIIAEFRPWESDYSIPLIHSLDVSAATGTNRYFGQIVTDPKTLEPSFTEKDGTTIAYEWIGKLKSGLHVLIVRSSGGGGSMVATDLMVFRLKSSMAQSGSKANYRQLLLEVVRVINLGDRAIPNIKLKGDKVSIKTEFNGPRKSEVFDLSFD